MQQMRKSFKQKRVRKPNAFISVISTWCAIADVKITLPEGSESDIEEIRELLDGKTDARDGSIIVDGKY